MAIGDRIKRARNFRGMTQKELGIAAGEITREEYQEWKLNWPQTADDCGKFTPARQWRKSKTAK